MKTTASAITIEELNRRSKGHLPGLLGMETVALDATSITMRLAVRPELLAPNGFLHAATVVALADTTCGYGTMAMLPEGATGFTTIELKTNFVGTARDGVILCRGSAVHLGRSTQVWDATVAAEDSGRTIAVFRCTQMILRG
ncbi:MAG TPA: PaaI family thioesterase [Burkholderiales bacterium]|jgi:uncharacterized protein (TIGR00369 family)|nr:PaaI family thioesterase [Burkholderiales bacterium]